MSGNNKTYRRVILLLSSCAMMAFNGCETGRVGQYVDPNIGGVAPLLTTVTPQVHRPHSMVRVFPVTEPGLSDRYLSDRLYGIALNMPRYRSGTVSSIMATTGELKVDRKSLSSWYDHGIERVSPWRHEVFLDDYGIDAEWTTTPRVAVFKFKFPTGVSGHNVFLCVSNDGEIEFSGEEEVSGYECVNYARQYFYAVADTRPDSRGTWKSGQVTGNPEVSGKDIGAWMRYDAAEEITVKVGISYISQEQAKANLEHECMDKDFHGIVKESEMAWEDALGKIRVEGGTESEKRIFYTSLYRTNERMVEQSEYGKYYSGFDRTVHEDSVPFYNDDWNWDTYRNLHALQSILDPDMKALHLQSYARMFEQWGWVPNFPELTENRTFDNGLKEEPMIGNHTASILAGAVAMGIVDFDIETLYDGVRKNSLQGTMVPWRSGAATELDAFYNEHGYFPALSPDDEETCPYVDDGWEKRQAVSVTLEHSYDDWCIAQVARYLGKDSDYELFMERSRNYLNLWNNDNGYFSPKKADGRWVEPFDPELGYGYGSRGYFAEVNACVHLFHVQHDIPKLIELMGGNEKFIERLDRMYNKSPDIGKWWFMGRMPDATGLQGLVPAGNEPAFHIPYLYNYAGAPWKTQHRVRQVEEIWFQDNPSGLSGDEDGGALTAWYVFSAMGFYPVNPASGEFAITSPIFSKVEISLPDGKVFTIKAPGASKENKYIASARLDGKALERPFISYEDIMSGATLELRLVDKPVKTWGVR